MYLMDKLKCLRFFCCFQEANNKPFYSSIQNGKIFYDKLKNISLTDYDIECATLPAHPKRIGRG